MRNELQMMLEQLVEKHRQVELQINDRFNAFQMPEASRVTSLQEFEDLTARLYWSLVCPALSTQLPALKLHAGHAPALLLEREYGANAHLHAFDIARSGAEGGLWGILQTLARLTQEQMFERLSLVVVTSYWQSTSAEQLVKDAHDYLKEYGHLMPGEMTEGSQAFLLGNFRKVLLEHPNLIRKLSHALRR